MAKKQQKNRTDQMLSEIRTLLGKYTDIPEREMYEALATEAEGWEMRLEELENDTDEN